MNVNPELMRKLNIAAHRIDVFTNLLYKSMIASFAVMFNIVAILVYALERAEIIGGEVVVTFDDPVSFAVVFMTWLHLEYWAEQFDQAQPISHFLITMLVMIPIAMAYLMATAVSPNSGTSIAAMVFIISLAGLMALVTGYVFEVAINNLGKHAS